MLLDAEQFDAILDRMANQPGAAAVYPPMRQGGGQRREPRFKITGRLTIVPFAPGADDLVGYDFPRRKDGSLEMPLGKTVTVPVRDLSRGGVRFVTPARLPLGTPFVLLLPNVEGQPPIAIETTVTYWQPVSPGLFAIGAQFHRMLDGFATPDGPVEHLLPEEATGEAILRRAV